MFRYGPMVVLERYKPGRYHAETIGQELLSITRKHGLIPHYDPAHGPIHWRRGWWSEQDHAEVRRVTISAPSAGDWHKDGDTTAGARMDCAIVTWASVAPT